MKDIWYFQSIILMHPYDNSSLILNNKKSIIISTKFNEILLYWNYGTSESLTSGYKILNLKELNIGDTIPDKKELYIEYEGKSDIFYYFHSNYTSSWLDNTLVVYAK